MEKLYKSIFSKKEEKTSKIHQLASIQESLRKIRKQMKEDGENVAPDDLVDQIENALISAIKTLGATNEITADLISTVGKVEGASKSGGEEVAEDSSMSSDSIEAGYNDENNQNMNTDMNEEDEEIIASDKEEMTSAEESVEVEEDSKEANDQAVEDMWGSDKEEGVTDVTQTTDDNPPIAEEDEQELEEDEELDREENMVKTGQYVIPGTDKVNESKIKKYERKFK